MKYTQKVEEMLYNWADSIKELYQDKRFIRAILT